MASNDERSVFFAHFSTVMREDCVVTSFVTLFVVRLRTARAKRITLVSAKLRIFGSVATNPVTTVELTMFFLPLLAVAVLLASMITLMQKKLILCLLLKD